MRLFLEHQDTMFLWGKVFVTNLLTLRGTFVFLWNYLYSSICGWNVWNGTMEEKDACAQFLTFTHLEQLVESLF